MRNRISLRVQPLDDDRDRFCAAGEISGDKRESASCGRDAALAKRPSCHRQRDNGHVGRRPRQSHQRNHGRQIPSAALEQRAEGAAFAEIWRRLDLVMLRSLQSMVTHDNFMVGDTDEFFASCFFGLQRNHQLAARYKNNYFFSKISFFLLASITLIVIYFKLKYLMREYWKPAKGFIFPRRYHLKIVI